MSVASHTLSELPHTSSSDATDACLLFIDTAVRARRKTAVGAMFLL